MLSSDPSRLPIHDRLDAVLDALSNGRDVLLSAPPGAGKSTMVPTAIADQTWCTGKVLISQPRCLAAVLLANGFIALKWTAMEASKLKQPKWPAAAWAAVSAALAALAIK